MTPRMTTMINYTVKAGDTVGKIAAQFLGDSKRYHEIAALNSLANPNLIYVGQVLRIPTEALDFVTPTATRLPVPGTADDILVGHPGSTTPLPGVYELPEIEGSAPRDWIWLAAALGAAYWALA